VGPSVASVIGGLVILAVVFGVLERRVPAVGGQSRWRPGWRVDVVWWFVTPLVTKTIARVAIVLALVLAALLSGVVIDQAHLEAFLAPRPAIARLPWLVQLLGLLLIADLLAYLTHRLLHSGVLWRFHAVHHSSTEVDWLSSVRVHPLNDVLIRLAQAVPIVLIGFDPLLIAAYVPIFTFYAILVHANVPWSFGPLRHVLASPLFHRWHHATEDDGLNRNFAGMFPFIDVAFGTFHMPRDRQPARFGIPGGDVPPGFWGQVAYPFRRTRRLARRETAALSPCAAAPRTRGA
jgi:sterol desaturase/sphingolipid hydroxylase (fatty acid hydroxylase superfamily)